MAMIHFDPFEPVRLRAEAARALFEENGIEIIEYVQGDPADSTGFASATVGDLLVEVPGGRARRDLGRVGRLGTRRLPGDRAADRTEVIVTGVDGQEFAIAEVAKGGNWIATVRQDWPVISTTALETIDACSAGTSPETQVITVEGQLITAENAATEGTAAATEGTAANESTAPSEDTAA